MFKVKIWNTKTMCVICSKLKTNTAEESQRLSGVFIVNYKQISHIVLVFSYLTLNKWMTTGLESLKK